MSKPYVIGMDMGGTNTVFGIVDARGQVVASDSIKTKKHVFNGIPVAVTNDANAAALGEMTYGAARGMKDFIMITLGTGVGSGIVVNGQLVYGHDGFAGELGHIIVKRNNGRVCGCGRTGCLEAYCSATGVSRTAREFLEVRTEPSVLRDLQIEDITSKDVYDAAIAGDKIAKDIFEYTGNILGAAMADMVAFSSPQAFVLFGGLTRERQRLFFQSSRIAMPPFSELPLSAGRPNTTMSARQLRLPQMRCLWLLPSRKSLPNDGIS